jgi:DNA-binding CsgD family transcriptional regulator
MRRIVVEMPAEDFLKQRGADPIYRMVRSFEVLHQLRSGPEGSSVIIRVSFRDPSLTPESLFGAGGGKMQVLDGSDGIFTCFVRLRGRSLDRCLGLGKRDGYVVPPLGISDALARMTFVGTSHQVERFLRRLDARRIRHRTVSFMDLRISEGSPLGVLTDKQREVLTTAYQNGYYDRPRRASSKALAGSLGLSSSTFVNHRLKAERRLLSVVLGQAGPQSPPGLRGGTGNFGTFQGTLV